jgi:hypothetical protein
MKNLSIVLWAVAALFMSSCETNDVPGNPVEGPEVTLSVTKQVISENGGQSDIVATLAASSAQDVLITLALSGTAQNGTHYNITSTQIVISAGNITSSVSVIAIDDTLKSGNKDVVIDIDNITGGFSDGMQQQTIIIEDEDVPPTVSLLINEVLYDPSNSGLDGDANGDGKYAQSEDEFIEFVNMSSQPLDLSGYEIYDAESLTAGTPSHLFPAGTIIQSGKAIVVFGGGTPTGTFGGATVQTSTSGDLNMNNAGDFMTILNPAGDVIVTFDITPLSDNPNESYTRNPDLTGAFEQHNDNTPLLFSPGTKINGSPF